MSDLPRYRLLVPEFLARIQMRGPAVVQRYTLTRVIIRFMQKLARHWARLVSVLRQDNGTDSIATSISLPVAVIRAMCKLTARRAARQRQRALPHRLLPCLSEVLL